MHFLAPTLLVGLLAAVLPWLIHRIGRRRANPVRFAAMELLMRAERQVSARRRMREIVLLVVRTTIAAALAFVFSRPYAEVRSNLPASAARPQSAVVVLDDSASLRRPGGGGSDRMFDTARARARALVQNLAAASEVALVLASEGTPTPVAEATSDRGRLLAALDGISCSARHADFPAALRKAGQILSNTARPERVIYLITDLQAAGWEAGARRAADETTNAEIVVMDVSEGAGWENRAVVSMVAEPAPEGGTLGVAVVAEIANWAAQPVQNLGVSLHLDGVEVARSFVEIPAGGRARKRFLHTLAAGGTAHEAEVRIDHDAFRLDDSRLARVDVSRGLRVLVINGDPRTVRTEDETFFLEAALRAGGNSFVVTTALPDDVPARRLDDYSAVFVANVPAPSEELATALLRYVEGGGGLFMSVGGKVDAEAWNRRARKLLPQPLGLGRTAAAPPDRAPEGETVDLRPAERLAPVDRRHPLLAAFAARGEGLASARFFQFMLLAPVAETAGRTVILRYENGAPALVEADVGRGRVLLLTTTVDREWTDLPIRPGFLPLVQEAARRLAGAPSGEAVAALVVGQRRDIRVGPDDRRIEVIKPSGGVRQLAPEPRARDARQPRTVELADTDEPGTYRVRAVQNDGSIVERPDEAFVVNVDPRESDPTRLAADKRPDRSRTTESAEGAPKRQLELWRGLALALLFLLLVESAVTVRLRRNPTHDRGPARS